MEDKTPNEDILWQLGTQDEPGFTGDDPLAEKTLEDYRNGNLTDDQARAVERRLGKDPQARRSFEKLAGLEQPDLPEGARERFLAFVEQRGDAEDLQIETRVETARPGSVLRWAAPLAIAAGILLAVLLLPGRAPTLPEGLGFEVAATGLAEVRGEVEGADSIRAEPDTRIQISATPEGTASNGLEFGLYRVEDSSSGLRLVASDAQLVVDRGAAYFEAAARDLVGSESGSGDLLLIVASAGDLPKGEVLEGDSRPALESGLTAEGRRLIYPIEIEIVEPEPPMSE